MIFIQYTSTAEIATQDSRVLPIGTNLYAFLEVPYMKTFLDKDGNAVVVMPKCINDFEVSAPDCITGEFFNAVSLYLKKCIEVPVCPHVTVTGEEGISNSFVLIVADDYRDVYGDHFKNPCVPISAFKVHTYDKSISKVVRTDDCKSVIPTYKLESLINLGDRYEGTWDISKTV